MLIFNFILGLEAMKSPIGGLLGMLIGFLIVMALVASVIYFAYQWKTSIRLLVGIPTTILALCLLFGPTNPINIVFFVLIVAVLLIRPPKEQSFGYKV